MRRVAKNILLRVFMAAAFPAAALSAFGKWKTLFTFFAQTYALIPGLPGDYLRVAFYSLTLTECSLSSRVSFGTFFAHPTARVGAQVYIGSFCILGNTHIGARSQIASGVQILSGKRQHAHDERGAMLGSEQGSFELVTIGADCWIGAASVVMANVGAGTTIGAGSVVTRPVAENSVAVGNPARVIGTESVLVEAPVTTTPDRPSV